MLYDDDQDDGIERDEASGSETPPSGDDEASGSETPPTGDDEASGSETPPAEREEPQPNHESLEVVTTSPEDGRHGPGRRRPQRSYNSRPGGLASDDPFWTFGTPPETWGSSVRKPGGEDGAQARRPREYLECRHCGVKIEKKRAHGRGKVPCSMCGRWMQSSRPV